MDEYEREMEIIALISHYDDKYKYYYTNKETVDHQCEKKNENRQLALREVEYFKDGKALEDKANFCEHCFKVYVSKPDEEDGKEFTFDS